RIVDVFAVCVGATDTLLDLAGDQDVAESGSKGGGELDRTHPAQCPSGETEVVEHLEVFEQRRFRVDVQCPQFTTTRARRDALFGVRQRCGVEGLGDTLPSLDLDEQHPYALVGQGETARRRER